MSRNVNLGKGLFIRGTDVVSPTGEYSRGQKLFISAENSSSIEYKTDRLEYSDPVIINSTGEYSFSKELVYNPDSFTNEIISIDINSYYNDIDIVDDIAVVANKDWTSIEKYEYDLKNVSGHIGILSNIHVVPSVLYRIDIPPCLDYKYEIVIDSNHPINESGYITFNYNTCSGSQTYTIYVPYHSYISFDLIATSTPTYTLGEGWVYDDPVDPIYVVDGPYINPGIEGVVCSGYYSGYPYNQCLKNEITGIGDLQELNKDTYINLTYIILTDFRHKDDYYNPIFQKVIFGDPVYGFEFVDYYSVEITIEYTTKEYLDDNIAFLNGSNNIINYTFGGFLNESQFIKKCQYLTINNEINGQYKFNQFLQDDEGYKWYIVYKDKTKESLFVCLSSYTLPSNIQSMSDLKENYYNLPLINRYKDNFSITYTSAFTFVKNEQENYNLLPDEASQINGVYSVLNNQIKLNSCKIYKKGFFPSCGKIDIYTKKTGNVIDITDNVILSSGHNLSNGDKIKISSALSSETLTNLNGYKYISGVNSDSFQLFYDSGLATPVSIITDSGRISGITWTAVDPKNWSYKNTLYSPMGKNGYGFDPVLRLEKSTGGLTSEIVVSDKDVSDKYGRYEKPQCFIDTSRGWFNFYPFDLNNDSLEFNGNRFGSDIQIEKYNDNYILMVTEPGAEVSFNIVNPDALQTNKQPVIPTHLPYGRIHFYSISGDLTSENWISYIGTVSNSGTHPWIQYEQNNLYYRKKLTFTYYNYPIDINDVSTYNATNNNYWQGARFYSWMKDYILNPVIRFELPDQVGYPYEFGWVDYFGKSAVFSISGDTIYGVASTHSKYAEWNIASGLSTVACQSLPFSIDITGAVITNPTYNTTQKQYSGIRNVTSFTTVNKDSHFEEIYNYGKNIDYNLGELFIGWNSTFKPTESIYIYSANSGNYSLNQEIVSAGKNNFGEYLIIDDNTLIANKYSKVDDSGNITINQFNALYVYKKDLISNKYFLKQRITPTINIGLEQNYDLLQNSQYEMTYNYAYDNSIGNSATQNIDLYGRYDLYKDYLVVRDFNGYAYFRYVDNGFKLLDYDTKSELNVTSNETSIIRLRPNNGSLIGNYTGGEFIDNLDLLDGSRNVINFNINSLISKSYVNPSFLPLFVKTIERVPSGSLDTFIHGKVLYNTSGEYPSGLTLYTQGPIPNTGTLDLFCKQVDVVTTGLNLRLQVYDISSASLDLRISSHVPDTGTLPLFVGTEFYKTFPMYMKTYAYTTIDPETGETIQIDTDGLGTLSETFSLYIQNSYTGVPNSSGQFNMYIQTDEYADYGKALNLAIGKNLDSTSSTIPLYLSNINQSTVSDSSVSGINLYTVGKGIPVDDSFNLFIKTPHIESLPLTLFNVYNTSEIDLFIRNADIYSSGIDLYTSGELYPTTTGNTLNLRIRGTSF